MENEIAGRGRFLLILLLSKESPQFLIFLSRELAVNCSRCTAPKLGDAIVSSSFLHLNLKVKSIYNAKFPFAFKILSLFGFLVVQIFQSNRHRSSSSLAIHQGREVMPVFCDAFKLQTASSSGFFERSSVRDVNTALDNVRIAKK